MYAVQSSLGCYYTDDFFDALSALEITPGAQLLSGDYGSWTLICESVSGSHQ